MPTETKEIDDDNSATYNYRKRDKQLGLDR
jgi:hypothetical protein